MVSESAIQNAAPAMVSEPSQNIIKVLIVHAVR